jgi:Flp pilus assembly protein TadG
MSGLTLHNLETEVDQMGKRNLVRNQKGQAFVEFAIVLPILLLLVFGIIQFGILFNNYLTLTDAVRAGARQAAVSRTLSDQVGPAIARVRAAAADLPSSADPSVLPVTVTPRALNGTQSWEQGGDVTVTATYPYSINLLGLVVKSGRMTSQTTERVE